MPVCMADATAGAGTADVRKLQGAGDIYKVHGNLANQTGEVRLCGNLRQILFSVDQGSFRMKLLIIEPHLNQR